LSAPVPFASDPGTPTGFASLLLLQARDTVVALPAPAAEWRLWIAVLTDLATIVIALALLVTVLILLLIALQVRKLVRRIDPIIDRTKSYVDPVLGHVRDMSENVNYMSAAIRSDVQQVTELVDSSRRRLNRAADAAEQRIREFNALLGVMQEEAEQLFIDSAATARGVRAGAESYRTFRGDRSAQPKDEAQIRVRPAPPTRTMEDS
jgi:hypothetical protein